MMTNPLTTLKEKFEMWTTNRKTLNVQRFAHANRSLLVIVCDPQDDTMFVSFGDKQISVKIRSADGLEHNVVKGVLTHSTFAEQIDRFLGTLIDVFRIPVDVGTTFYSFIDGALFNISKVLKGNDKNIPPAV